MVGPLAARPPPLPAALLPAALAVAAVMLAAVLLAAVSLMPSTGWGAEPAPVGVEGGEEVIRAPASEDTAAPPPPSRLAGARTVVTREQFAGRGNTVADVLETVPGVTVLRTGDPLAPTRVSLRGSQPDQVLVLLDGVPLNAETANPARARAEGRQGVDLASLPLERVASIEIVRGAASSAYGPGAEAGVVLIRSRRSREERGELHRKIGAGGYRETGGAWSRPWGSGVVDLDLTLKETRGEFLFYNPQPGGATGTGAGDPCLEDRGGGYFLRKCNARRAAILSTGWEREAGQRWSLQIEQAEREGLGGVENPQPFGREERTRYQLGLAQSWPREEQGAAGLSLNGTRLFSRSTSNAASGSAELESHYQETRAEADLWAERWRGRHRFRAGTSVRHERLDDRYFEAGRDRASLYGQWSDYLAAGTLEGSLRYDAYSDVASRGTWRLAATHRLGPAWGLKGSAGTGYRPPTLYELYDPGSPAGPSAANPSLRPESSVSADGGAFLEFGEGMYIEALAFRQEFRDAIVAIADPASPSLFRFANVARTRSTGLESSLNLPLPGGLRLDLSATALTATIVASDRNDVRDVGHRVPGVPERQWSAGLTWRRAGWLATWKLRHRDLRYVDTANTRLLRAYTVQDAGVSVPLPWGFEGALDGTNLTNETYAELDNFPAPGRLLFVTLRWRYPPPR